MRHGDVNPWQPMYEDLAPMTTRERTAIILQALILTPILWGLACYFLGWRP